MKNSNALIFFEQMSKKISNNPQSVKLAANVDFTYIDASFILEYANRKSSILDIGTGTGLIINKIYKKVKYIECVEPYKNFTKFINKSSNIKIINKTIYDYDTDKSFDIVTMFGFMHYVGEYEAIKIYEKCFKFLKYAGKIIVKNQFGIKEDVNVAGYSEEQKTNYFAQYRHIDKEIKILNNAGFKNIQIFDIYPPEANRWHNTHFYAITAEK